MAQGQRRSGAWARGRQRPCSRVRRRDRPARRARDRAAPRPIMCMHMQNRCKRRCEDRDRRVPLELESTASMGISGVWPLTKRRRAPRPGSWRPALVLQRASVLSGVTWSSPEAELNLGGGGHVAGWAVGSSPAAAGSVADLGSAATSGGSGSGARRWQAGRQTWARRWQAGQQKWAIRGHGGSGAEKHGAPRARCEWCAAQSPPLVPSLRRPSSCSQGTGRQGTGRRQWTAVCPARTRE
jgi:hypothetical protein